MQKRLVQVGTSLALVIDKAVLQMWNVTRMSRLSVELEGGRLVIAPVAGGGDPRPSSRREALQVVHELRQLGFKQAHCDRLAPAPMRLGTYVTRLDGTGELPAERGGDDVSDGRAASAAARRLEPAAFVCGRDRGASVRAPERDRDADR